jgi:hypothetical protein
MAGLIKELDIVIGSAKLQADHPELFHYTRPEGFRAIIGSQTLWAALFRDLKDQQEIRVLKPVLRTAIVDLFDKAVAKRSRAVKRRFDHCGGATFQADKFVDSVYKSTFDRNDPRFAVDAFTTSFTTHAADSPFERENGLLSQWTEYAPDGFCIVLDTVEMCRLLGLEFDARDYTHLNLEPIRYAFEGVPLRDHFPDLEPALISSIEQFLNQVYHPEMAMIEFLQSATLLKEPGYQKSGRSGLSRSPARPATRRRPPRSTPTTSSSHCPGLIPIRAAQESCTSRSSTVSGSSFRSSASSSGRRHTRHPTRRWRGT